MLVCYKVTQTQATQYCLKICIVITHPYVLITSTSEHDTGSFIVRPESVVKCKLVVTRAYIRAYYFAYSHPPRQEYDLPHTLGVHVFAAFTRSVSCFSEIGFGVCGPVEGGIYVNLRSVLGRNQAYKSHFCASCENPLLKEYQCKAVVTKITDTDRAGV